MHFNFQNIKSPTLVLNKEIVLRNIKRMNEKARQSQVTFRPHFKTHQSAEIGAWFREFGVSKITVSSLAMAEYFAKSGWQDITLAFPVNVREIDRINRLAEIIQLNLLVENEEAIRFLDQHLRTPVALFIKVDTGLNRTGIWWKNHESIVKLVSILQSSQKLHFSGFLTHAGHSYDGQSTEAIKEIYAETLIRLQAAKSELQKQLKVACVLSVGDTPGCSIIDNFEGVDEIRPGNFVFYDVMQLNLGACTQDDIAIALACPVVAKHPSRQQIVVHGGAVHLSRESLASNNEASHFGLVVHFSEETGWGKIIDETYVRSLSQEHGIIQAGKQLFNQTKIGDLLGILPVHSCLTANLMGEYFCSGGHTIKML
ncbi:MAG: alanine racemase [Calditrichaeota bacterium]|nr:MAG: alanine racemase [Calditrichota bacterium]